MYIVRRQYLLFSGRSIEFCNLSQLPRKHAVCEWQCSVPVQRRLHAQRRVVRCVRGGHVQAHGRLGGVRSLRRG